MVLNCLLIHNSLVEISLLTQLTFAFGLWCFYLEFEDEAQGPPGDHAAIHEELKGSAADEPAVVIEIIGEEYGDDVDIEENQQVVEMLESNQEDQHQVD